jgi:hypothetical protein
MPSLFAAPSPPRPAVTRPRRDAGVGPSGSRARLAIPRNRLLDHVDIWRQAARRRRIRQVLLQGGFSLPLPPIYYSCTMMWLLVRRAGVLVLSSSDCERAWLLAAGIGTAPSLADVQLLTCPVTQVLVGACCPSNRTLYRSGCSTKPEA